MAVNGSTTSSRATKPSAIPLSAVFIWIGLATVSWDRLGNLTVGTYNLRLPLVTFAIGFILSVCDYYILNRTAPKTKPAMPLLMTFVALTMAIVALTGINWIASFQNTAAYVLSSFIPFLAVYLFVRVSGRLEECLTAFIIGAVVAALYGVYQLVAFYTGLPQGIPYESVGGGLGRISAFNYESGYFGYFIILAIAAVYARARLTAREPSKLLLLFLAGALVLANTRASIFTIPLLVVFMFAGGRVSARVVRWLPALLALSVLGLLISAMIPGLYDQMFLRMSTVFDPTEPTSNAPRLARLAEAARVIQGSPWVGVGPGNFAEAAGAIGIQSSGEFADNKYIANNIWYQAMLDGGAFLLALESALVVSAVHQLYRKSLPTARALMAGWLSVFTVSSLITSYYFDTKLWVILAMALAAARQAQQEKIHNADGAGRSESPSSSPYQGSRP
ncbi:O-antigen ligase family protein [Sinomonas albida]|uniref:O-antigen ligase family protein n=1 Tax=Sinomonas albida TaxID=369942 RepID=UPI001457B0D6|nr:O-antigen ligase family protein [Sinomonas albida]